MVDERESPSADWRTVYDEMGADTEIEAATHSCPDCGRHCENVCRNVYECADHGVFRASTSDGESSSAAESDETVDEADDRAPGRAD